MVNIIVAQTALELLKDGPNPKALEAMQSFINSVEQLMKHNSIKQTPLLLCPQLRKD